MRLINQININRYIQKIAFLSIYLAACFSPLFVISKLQCILFPGDCAGSAGGLGLTYDLFLAPIIFTVSNIFTISLQKKIKNQKSISKKSKYIHLLFGTIIVNIILYLMLILNSET